MSGSGAARLRVNDDKEETYTGWWCTRCFWICYRCRPNHLQQLVEYFLIHSTKVRYRRLTSLVAVHMAF